ncbi:hypothetical protein N7539_007962 [Penicillium diatomitis]|uniref:Uncharacterized protein n=1 Tax=Penicillium diatomitis TaxID=2819901 RepID=A0A9X0BNG3_9EURO|nr:uncharacterized protein N7539_007962 [Penicillium diatomitis]KAJ5475675.1 hypothetical protein N7539_007962 [Penicillium diatomitis]
MTSRGGIFDFGASYDHLSPMPNYHVMNVTMEEVPGDGILLTFSPRKSGQCRLPSFYSGPITEQLSSLLTYNPSWRTRPGNALIGDPTVRAEKQRVTLFLPIAARGDKSKGRIIQPRFLGPRPSTIISAYHEIVLGFSGLPT